MVRSFVVIALALTGSAISAQADGSRHRHIDATPFSHAPCSVLSQRPCAPSTCSVFNHGPCIPEIDYPYGENLQLTVESDPDEQDAAKYVRPDHDLNTIADLFAALRSCWQPPPQSEAREGMQISVRFSFKRSGAIFGAPQVTYATRDAPAEVRKTYLSAITASLDSCTPLPFSEGLGGALAGRPIMIRFIDNRTTETQPH